MTPGEILALCTSALAAGAINAVAGGGTVLTFPALLFSGTGAVAANATSTFALTMGTAGSLLGFRLYWSAIRPWIWRFIPVSIAGSIGGSWLVRHQGEAAFVRAVPWLLLFATVLFLLQEPLRKWRRKLAGKPLDPDQAPPVAVCVAMQGLVAFMEATLARELESKLVWCWTRSARCEEGNGRPVCLRSPRQRPGR